MGNKTLHNRGHYIHSVTYSHRERLVGAFLAITGIVVVVLLAANIAHTGLFEGRVVYQADLGSAKGVNLDTPVRIAGIEAGHVSAIDFADAGNIRIELSIYERYGDRIRANAVATLNRLSVLGGAVVEIAPGTRDMPPLRDGAAMEIRETLSIDQVLEGVGALLYRSEDHSVAALIDDIRLVAQDLRAITGRIRSGEGAIGRALYDEQFNESIARSLESLHALLGSATNRVDQTDAIVSDAKTLTGDLKSAAGEMPGLVSDLHATLEDARLSLALFRDQMQGVPEFMGQADLVLRDSMQLIRAMERIWPVSAALESVADEGLVGPQHVHD